MKTVKTRLFKHEHVNSKSAVIRRYILAHPDHSCRTVAEKCGADIAVVYNVRHRLQKQTNMSIQKLSAMSRKTASTTSVTVTVPPTPEMPIQMVDMVNSPPHYKVGGIETIDYIKAKLSKEEYRGYLKGNILKYGSRVGHKGNTAEDAGKLSWYAQRLAELGE